MGDAPVSVPDRDPEAGAPTGKGERRRLRIGWCVLCLAFFLISAGWALALPVDGTYDEAQHLIRAYGAASGQLYSPPAAAARGGGAWYDVPRSLLPDNVNCPWKGEDARAKRSAACQHTPPDDTSLHRVGTTAGRYNPVYYLPVGIPMVLLPHTTGILLGRLVSGLMSAMLLASATVIALRLRNRLMIVAIVLAATPMTVNLSGAINPNGLEIAAGVLLWATLLALLRTPDGTFDNRTIRRLLILAAIAASLLLTLRALGPLWLVGILVTTLIVAVPGRLAALIRRIDTWVLLVVVALVAGYAAWWLAFSGVTEAVPTRGGSEPLENMIRLMLVDRSSFWTDQIVGVFSYGETRLPSWLTVFWYAMVAALVLPAALLAPRRERWAVAGVGIASVLALVAFEVVYYPTLNWAQHGRYVMPLGVGLLLVAAVVGRYATALRPTGQLALLRMVAIGTAPLHLFALALVMTRFQSGPGAPLSPFTGEWLPPTGPVVPFLATVAGLLVLVWYAFRGTTWFDSASALGRERSVA